MSARKRLVGIVLISLVAAVLPAATAATAAAKPSAPANPYSPAAGHPYRHGAFATVSQHAKMQSWSRAHPAAITATGPETLAYGGGIDGIGVTSGTPRVYLVFWGTQWGTQGTDASGNLTFTNDPRAGAPYLQKLFRGLGTGNELWSGTMTQYCDGATVATGATTCPSGAPHVGYPTGGALAGVWYDNSAAEPSAATGHQLGQEAVNAAGHFGNTTAASNRYAQYVVLSATGLNPDNYKTGGFCAWHDYNGDTTLGGGAVTSPYGDIAFTNMPYVMDAGTSCGQNFVNAGTGTLDGYSIVEGHEYAETVTDQNPAGGWTNHQANSFGGQENGDECAWISSGQGASANVTMGTGTFAMQSTWSNDTNRCDISHPIVSGAVTNDFSIAVSPLSGSVTAGQSTTATVTTAVTSGSAQTVSLSASGLPSGATASFSPTSVTSGGSSTLTLTTAAATPAGSYSITITGTGTSATHATTYTLSVAGSGGGSGGITNGGFETGTLSGWTPTGAANSVVTTLVHSGAYADQSGATTATNGDSSVAQTFTVPSGLNTLSFWYDVICPDTLTYDWATASLADNTAGTTTTVLAKTCVSNSGWRQATATVVAGHSYTLTMTSHDDNYSSDPTYTHFDDVTLSATTVGPNVVTNGGFEAASLTGWTSAGSTAVVTSPVHSGSDAGRAGATTPTGTSSLAQTFTAASGDTQLAFWYDVICPDTVTYDWATATLRDNTTGTTTTPLGKTCVANSGWRQVTATLVAGHSYTLTLTSHDDNYPGDPTYTVFDDIATS